MRIFAFLIHCPIERRWQKNLKWRISRSKKKNFARWSDNCQKCHDGPPSWINQFEAFKNLFTILSFDAVNWMTNFERTEIFIERIRRDDEWHWQHIRSHLGNCFGCITTSTRVSCAVSCFIIKNYERIYYTNKTKDLLRNHQLHQLAWSPKRYGNYIFRVNCVICAVNTFAVNNLFIFQDAEGLRATWTMDW